MSTTTTAAATPAAPVVSAAAPIAVPEIKTYRKNGTLAPKKNSASAQPQTNFPRAGKCWKETKAQFRPGMRTARPTYDQRKIERDALAAMKTREKELKDEKVAKKEEMINKIKEKREKRAEKERFEKLAEKMHAKKVDRLRRREKRNKALKER